MLSDYLLHMFLLPECCLIEYYAFEFDALQVPIDCGILVSLSRALVSRWPPDQMTEILVLREGP